MLEEKLAEQIIAASIKVHRQVGPGLLESVYQKVLCLELKKRGIDFHPTKPIPLYYDGILIEKRAFIADIVVENRIVVELKSVQAFEKVHFKQLLTYLRLLDLKVGLLINFNEVLLKDGLKRVIRS